MHVFYCYSHEDEVLRSELEKQLAMLKRKGLVTDWSDRAITGGQEWAKEIDSHLNQSEIILLLVSPDFLASDYCYDIEIRRAMELQEADEAQVIPIILRPCDWQDAPFGKLQALPKGGKPITTWDNQDNAFLDVVHGIRKVIETRQPSPPLPSFSSSSNLITEPPILKTWVGREGAAAKLVAWIADSAVPLIGIQGLGGVGKSALAAHIFNEFRNGKMPLAPTSSRFLHFQWADVSQKTDFVTFAEGVVTGLGGKLIQPGDSNLLVNQLFNFLRQQPCLVVVDNLETLLTETGDWQDSAYEKFFNRWIEQQSNTILLLTTREKPTSFKAWEYWYCLEGLKPERGAQLLLELKIKGREAELEAFAQSVDGHPLTLRLVAGFLLEYCDGELSEVDKLGLEREELIFQEASGLYHDRMNARLSWILDQHLQRLTPQEYRFLLNLTVYRQPFDEEAAAWMWEAGDARGDGKRDGTFPLTEDEGAKPIIKPFIILKKLAELRNRSLLLDIGSRYYQFQFLVQRYLQQILVRRYSSHEVTDLSFAHQRALRYYLFHLKPEPWNSLDDLSQYLEAFYHYCQLKHYPDAYEILHRCHTFLDLRGYYQKLIEMYGALAREWQPEDSEARVHWAWAWTRWGHAYLSTGEFRSALDRYQRARKVFCEVCDRIGEATASRGLGFAYNGLGQYRQAIVQFRWSLGITKENGDLKERMICLRGMGNAHFNLAKYRQAIRFYEKSHILAKEINDAMGEAFALNWLGNAYHCLGEYGRAIDFHKKSLAIRTEIGDRAGEGNSLSNSGNGYYFLGKYQQAINFYQQSLHIRREIGDRNGEATSLDNMGVAYHSLGEYGRAIDLHYQSLAIRRDLGNRDGEGTSLNNLGHAYFSLGDYEQAIDLIQQAVEIFKAIDSGYGRADALTRLGKAYNSSGRFEQAIDIHQQSLKIAKAIGQRDVEADACCGLGDVYLSLGKYTEAREWYRRSLDITHQINYRRGEADALFNLGVALAELGSASEAVTELQNARQLYQEMALAAKVQQCNDKVSKILAS